MNDPKIHRVLSAARVAFEAYENRFGSTFPVSRRPRSDVNLVGPIDPEMSDLRLAFDALDAEAVAEAMRK